jgi:ATP-binding protein involved in chromosome partitioning
VAMFQAMDVRILGIAENMSGFRCPHCHETTYIFGRNGAAKEAVSMNVPLLAKIPLVPALVEASDRGEPTKAIEADPELSDIFSSMAAKVVTSIGMAAK